MIAALKAALRAPVAFLLNAAARCTGRRAGLVIAYHRVGDPHEDLADRLMPALGTRAFDAQIRHLKRRYTVVPASRILAASEARRRWQRFPVAITFDDDTPSHVAAAMPILQRRQVPATFFLSGASLEQPHAYWYDRLQVAIDRGLVTTSQPLEGLSPGGVQAERRQIHDIAEAIKTLAPAEYDRVAEELLQRLGSDPPEYAMSKSDVRALAGAGYEIGFHTLRHYILPSLDDRSLARAMEEGRSELASLVGAEMSMIAYPNGDADRRVANAARSAAYTLGFTADPRAVLPGTDALLIGRVYTEHDRAVGRFAHRIASVLTRRP